jgi:NAD(P)-dependent dehydrogenase (short-subunit alcohol dehydrogenase family)
VRERRALLAVLGDEQRARLLRAAGEVARPDPWAKRELARAARRRRRAEVRASDEETLEQTGIRRKRQERVFVTPVHPIVPVAAGADIDAALGAQDVGAEPGVGVGAGTRRVLQERSCYVCKCKFQTLHFFYDSMCTPCGDLNWRKRQQTADLSGRVALITGARVKIGYQAAVMLLRAGAEVVVTTRFPRDAAARYALEADFAQWSARLQIHGLDLRHTPSVEAFSLHLCKTLDRLDFILNNACQTVRRPAGFYAHLMRAEREPVASLPAPARRLLEAYETMRGTADSAEQLTHVAARADSASSATEMRAATLQNDLARAAGLQDPAGLSQVALLAEDLPHNAHLFPRGDLDADLQQVDLRLRNSWRLPLAEVSAVELLEVQLVNSVAPFLLNARLKALMLREPSRDKHIVNVSAMEGQFYRAFKTDKHPHTNMAKAALNMMTRTSARDYIKDGIHMNSVDTGWVTDEDPAEIAARKTRDHGFHPPLDIVDGAARICDPIFSGMLSGSHVWGLFLKDYAATDW